MKDRIRFLVLLLIIFIDTMGYGLLIPVLLRLIVDVAEKKSGISFGNIFERNSFYGFAIALGPFAYLISAPWIGSLSDKWGRKKTLAACLWLSLIGFLIPVWGFFKNNLILILIGRFLAGMGSVSQPVAQAAVLDISPSGHKARNLAYVAFSMTLAMAAGPLLGGYLSNPHLSIYFNNSTPFIVASILVLINLILLFVVWKGEELRKGTISKNFKEHFSAYRNAFQKIKLRYLMLILFFYEFSWSLYFQNSAFYLNQAYHYSVETTSLFASYLAAWMCIGLIVIYPLISKRSTLPKILKTMLLMNAISLAGCAIFSLLHISQWIFSVFLVLGVGMAYPTLLALIEKEMPDKKGELMGVSASMLSSSWMLSGFIMGELSSVKLSLPIYIAAIFMIGCFIYSLKFFSIIKIKN